HGSRPRNVRTYCGCRRPRRSLQCAVSAGSSKCFPANSNRHTNPLDSCNENLPEERIHRNYASCPGGRTAPVFSANDIHHDANHRLQKIKGVVLGLLFTMEIPTTTCGSDSSPHKTGSFKLARTA